jgi:hypothetical protein
LRIGCSGRYLGLRRTGNRRLEEFHDLYFLPNDIPGMKSRKMRLAGGVGRVGEGRGMYRVLVGKPEGKRPLGRPRCRWEDNINMGLKEIG